MDKTLSEEQCKKPKLDNSSAMSLPYSFIGISEKSLLSYKEERTQKEKEILKSGKIPTAGSLIPEREVKRAGDYILGPCIGSSPVHSIVTCLGKHRKTGELYTLKILTIKDSEKESQDDQQGKMLLHTEHSLLSLLSGQPGIIKQHGLFQDYAPEVKIVDGKMVATGNVARRLFLVLDWLTPHEYSPYTADYTTLQQYVIKKGALKEADALLIFFHILQVVNSLHEQNIVHRDIKLANIVLNQSTYKITLTNFCLGQHLVSESDMLHDQRGSPAYVSPEVLSNEPYLGKPSDMWALGVVLFTMVFGRFPFYDKVPQELFKKIKNAEYEIPVFHVFSSCRYSVSKETFGIINSLFRKDPKERGTCSEILNKVTEILSSFAKQQLETQGTDQFVPDVDSSKKESSRCGLIDSENMNEDSLKKCYLNTDNIDHLIADMVNKKKGLRGLSQMKIHDANGSSVKYRYKQSIPCSYGNVRQVTVSDLMHIRAMLSENAPLPTTSTSSSTPSQSRNEGDTGRLDLLPFSLFPYHDPRESSQHARQFFSGRMSSGMQSHSSPVLPPRMMPSRMSGNSWRLFVPGTESNPRLQFRLFNSSNNRQPARSSGSNNNNNNDTVPLQRLNFVASENSNDQRNYDVPSN